MEELWCLIPYKLYKLLIYSRNIENVHFQKSHQLKRSCREKKVILTIIKTNFSIKFLKKKASLGKNILHLLTLMTNKTVMLERKKDASQNGFSIRDYVTVQ